MAKKYTKEDFVRRSNAVHNGKYDYSKAEYKNNATRVTIICPTHGEFTQRPVNHMCGRGCLKCQAQQCSDREKGNTAEFIEKARSVHGTTYDYAKTEYHRANKKVIIICKIHGEFLQTPNQHLSKKAGCPRCAGKNRETIDFVEEAKAVHGNRFSYEKTKYSGIKLPLVITCCKHGDFKQTAEGHLTGRGCAECAREATSSAGEDAIAMLIERDGHRVIRNDRVALGGLEIDILAPDKGTGFEFNGCYWHSHRIQKNSKQHQFKQEAARRAGIRLVTVWDFDWKHKRAIVDAMIKNALGSRSLNRVGARSCKIAEISQHDASSFYINNHIQGACRGAVYNAALVAGGDIVAAMSFTSGGARRGISEDGEIELARYATSGIVAGGAGRLLTHAIKTLSPKTIWSFSDDQHFTGKMYSSLGFSRDGFIPADYRIVNPSSLKVWHKSLWQRKSIPARLRELGIDDDFDPATDERTEFMMHDVAGVLRVYDAGKTRWVMRV